jgi:secreted PhoX family phosphatase
MKKTVITLAAMLLASNVAMAANSAQSTSTASFQSIDSLLASAAKVSNASVSVSTKAGNSLANTRDAINAESRRDLAKGGVIHTSAGSMSALGAFSVAAVTVSVQASTKITYITFEGLQSGSRMVVRVTEKYVATPVAKGVDSSAQATVDGAKYVGGKVVDGAKYIGRKTVAIGTGVAVGLSASGTILIQELGEAGKAGLNSQSLTSGAILLGSVSHSTQALGSNVVKGFQK